MRIAMIGHKQVPSGAGGVEVVVEELAVRMAAQGHTVALYNRGSRGKKRQKTYKGVRLYSVPVLPFPGVNVPLYAFCGVVCALLKGYDVIHLHAEGPGCAALLTRLFRVPSVVSVHGLDWKRSKWGRFASGYLKWAEKISVLNADEMIVLSESSRQYFQSTYGRKTRLIPNGTLIGKYRPPMLLRSLGIEKNDYVLFLARLVPEKGLHYLLSAFRKADTDKKLIIAGSFASEDAYARKIRRMTELDPRVRMVGFVRGRLREELYSNCCLYVLPSEVEGMALSLLEALGFGVPCLVSDIPENREIAESYLHFFRKGDTGHLREQLELLLKQSAVAERRKEQVCWIRENYSWDLITEQTMGIYRRVIEKYENTDCQ